MSARLAQKNLQAAGAVAALAAYKAALIGALATHAPATSSLNRWGRGSGVGESYACCLYHHHRFQCPVYPGVVVSVAAPFPPPPFPHCPAPLSSPHRRAFSSAFLTCDVAWWWCWRAPNPSVKGTLTLTLP